MYLLTIFNRNGFAVNFSHRSLTVHTISLGLLLKARPLTHDN